MAIYYRSYGKVGNLQEVIKHRALAVTVLGIETR